MLTRQQLGLAVGIPVPLSPPVSYQSLVVGYRCHRIWIARNVQPILRHRQMDQSLRHTILPQVLLLSGLEIPVLVGVCAGDVEEVGQRLFSLSTYRRVLCVTEWVGRSCDGSILCTEDLIHI